MQKKLTKKELAKIEAERDVWQEVLESVEELRQGGGKRTTVPTNIVVDIRLRSGLTQAQFASILGRRCRF